jgi:hypothetical protein
MMVYAWLPDARVGLVAVTVKSKVPSFVGIPVSLPSAPSVSPSGRSPEATAKVNGPGGPDAVTTSS